jgi:hypothetical protein
VTCVIKVDRIDRSRTAGGKVAVIVNIQSNLGFPLLLPVAIDDQSSIEDNLQAARAALQEFAAELKEVLVEPLRI